MSFSAKVDKETEPFKSVNGTFYRTIDTAYKSKVISGSRLAGRYSTQDQPSLYLSATLEGMMACIGVHKANRSENQEVVKIEVTAKRIFDLRDDGACKVAGIDLNDAISPWQESVAQGKKPRSWTVRDRIIELGGQGLIDPSRQIPGLWHLVLFDWNQEGTPRVRVVE